MGKQKMVTYTNLIVDRSNGTYSDTLEVFGLMRLVRDFLVLAGEDSPYLRLHDHSSYYVVDIDPGIKTDMLEILRQSPLNPIKAIPTNQYNQNTMPAGIPFVDSDAINAYFAAIKAKSEELPPRPLHLDVIQTINPEAIQGYNGTVIKNWWLTRHKQPEIFALILNMYSPNVDDRFGIDPVEVWSELNSGIEQKIPAKISGQQLFNPDQGMGQNAPKADSINSAKKKINFWITEYLRAVGFYEVAIPRYVGYKDQSTTDKDRKILVPQPLDLTYADNQAILREFKDQIYSEPHIQFDLMAAMRYLSTLLRYFMEPNRRHRLRTFGNVKHRVIKGFAIAFYKNMGRGRALLNYSFLDFPGWVVINSLDDADEYVRILDELITFTRQFEEKNSDAFALLQHLRDFVSGDDLAAFFKLMNGFAAYYMGRNSRDFKYRLHIKTVENIIMKVRSDLGEIITNPGFLSIARAIRASTVTAQFLNEDFKNKKKRYPYEVRYGLSQTLLRKSNHPDEFVQALTEFVISYMAESARVLEMKMKSGEAKKENKYYFEGQRAGIYEDDLAQVVQLVAGNNPKTVANLLISFGYIRTGSRKNQSDDNLQEED